MDAFEYERYVAELVSQLRFGRHVAISRNRRFEGVRQPGHYEVDIAVEFHVDKRLRFLLVVECKNWSRPVDRPVVQQLVQTRDAISAHKAAIASPLGFTSEAIEVATAHGVALWVISTIEWITWLSVGGRLFAESPHPYTEARLRWLKSMRLKPGKPYRDKALIRYDSKAVFNSTTGGPPFRYVRDRGVGDDDKRPGVDPYSALYDVANMYANAIGVVPVTSDKD